MRELTKKTDIIEYLDQLTFDYTQLCQRGDGTIYGIASGKLCRRGKPIAYNPNDERHRRIAFNQKLKKPRAIARLLIGKFKKLGGNKSTVREAKKQTVEEIKSGNVKGKGIFKAFGKKLDNLKEKVSGKSKKLEKAKLKEADRRSRANMEAFVKTKAIDERASKLIGKNNTQKIKDKLNKAIRERKITPEKALEAYERRISNLEKNFGNILKKKELKEKKSRIPKGFTIDNYSGFVIPLSPKGYNIEDDIKSTGKKFLGKGAFGMVRETSGPNPRVIKEGQIGQYEAESLGRLEGTGIAPKFYGISIKERSLDERMGRKIVNGNLSMSKIEGTTASQFMTNEKRPEIREKIERNIISARGVMHKEKVAHNDFHTNNVIVRGDGTIGVIDFGLSNISYKSAYSEAIDVNGHFAINFYGTHRSSSFPKDSVVFKKYQENIKKASEFLDDFEEGSISDDIYRQAIDIVYEGF